MPEVIVWELFGFLIVVLLWSVVPLIRTADFFVEVGFMVFGFISIWGRLGETTCLPKNWGFLDAVKVVRVKGFTSEALE